jgi:hypothetical protein
MTDNTLGEPTWWLQRDGQLYGPYPLATLRFVLQDRRARPSDLAGPSESGPWQPLGELIASIPPPPAVPSAPPPPVPVAPAPPPPPTLIATPAASSPVTPPRPAGRGGLGWALGAAVLLGLFVAIPLVTVGPVYREARAKAVAQAAKASLQQVGLALEVYTEGNGGLLPPAGQWERGVQTILKEPAQLRGPGGQAFVYNETLSGRRLADIRQQQGLELARDPVAYRRGRGQPDVTLVLRANGAVEEVASAEQPLTPPSR